MVLHGLDLTVGPGEPVALMGRNGVGKTTLLKTVMGLLRPRGGTIRFDGARIDGLPPFRIARAGIAYVPQGREVFADLTVEENLILGDLAAADAGRGYALFPALAERRARAGRPAVRRPAAAARHRPRPDGEAAACCCSTSRPRACSPRW